MEERFLIRNAVKCTHCGDVIESTHRHDYVSCSCRKTFTDGGDSYIRRGGNFEDMCIYSDADFNLIREHLKRGTYGISGDEPYRQVVLKDIEDDWLQAIIEYEERWRPDNKYLKFFIAEKEFRTSLLNKS